MAPVQSGADRCERQGIMSRPLRLAVLTRLITGLAYPAISWSELWLHHGSSAILRRTILWSHSEAFSRTVR